MKVFKASLNDPGKSLGTKILGMGIGNFVVIIINYSYYGEAEFFFCLRVFIGAIPKI